MTTLRRQPKNGQIINPMSLPVSFYEHGPVRQIVETEFEACLMHHLMHRDARVDRETEKIIHDAVVPLCVLDITENARTLRMERNRYVLSMPCHLKISRRMNREIMKM